MWAFIDINGKQIAKLFLFYKDIKFDNIIRNDTGPTIVKNWIQEKRKEVQLSATVKGQFLITKHKQENSKQIKQFLNKIGNNFHVTYVDDLASHGVAWGDKILETLVDLGSTKTSS